MKFPIIGNISSNGWKLDEGLFPDDAGEDVGAGGGGKAGDAIEVRRAGEGAQRNDPLGGCFADTRDALQFFFGGGVEVDRTCNFRMEQGVDFGLFKSCGGAQFDEPVGVGFRPDSFAF